MVYGGPQTTNVAVHPSTVERQTDIDLARDGLLTTCSKLFWVWNNKEAIQDKRRKEFLEDFQKGQQDIDEALHRIATSEQRVARLLIEQGPPPAPKSTWTEEQQRAQNDLYWMGGQAAFWLNPRGLFADPTPAPEWWSPPVDYKSLTQRHLTERQEDDVVALSLLAPPAKEEVNVERPAWLGRHDGTGVVYALHTQEEVNAFCGARKFEGVGYTVSKEYGIHSGPSYLELFDIYKKQGWIVPALPEDIRAKREEKTREMMLDELLAELENIGEPGAKGDPGFDAWNEAHKVEEPKGGKIRTGTNRKGQVVPVSKDGLFLVEWGNTVRGFPNRLEAETFIGEQRTLAQQKMAQQEDLNDKTYYKSVKDYSNVIKGDKLTSKTPTTQKPSLPRPQKMMK